MVDLRFYNNKSPCNLIDIAKHIGAELDANIDRTLSNVAPIEDATSTDLTFLSNKKYTSMLTSSGAGACIVGGDCSGNTPQGMHLLKVPNPYYSYALALRLFYAQKVSETSDLSIHPSAKIGHNTKIGHYCVIESGVEIEDGAVIGSGVFLGQGVKIGKNARIDSGVSISYAIIGDNVVILPGAKIGQDGFGFATHQGMHYKIFHVGRVLIGNNVEIGANTTIDRGSLQDTIIEDGVMVDNLVQIAHNVHIGRGSIIVAQVGIAGSSKIGKYCALGGQVGVAGHINIADKVQISGQGGVIQDISTEGVIMGGTPAVPIRDWHRQTIMLKKLIHQR